MADYALPKTERLHSLMAVRRLFKDGASGFVYPFRYMVYTEQSATAGVEVLFSVPKRYHKRANKRNLIRRRTKESYRLNSGELKRWAESRGVAIDVALVYSAKEVLPYKSIEHGVCRVLDEIAKRN